MAARAWQFDLPLGIGQSWKTIDPESKPDSSPPGNKLLRTGE
jgi:hypothetical protein